MAAINKNFVVKNGIEVGDNLIFGNKDQLRVGIGTTIPNYTLEVRGGIGATFVSVGQSITAGTAAISTVRSTDLTVGGGVNFNSGIGTALNVSGVTTVGSLSIGSTQVISSGRQLQNIASLDATTTATIEAAIASGPNTFTDLIISGIATFNNNVGVAGIVTAAAISASWGQIGYGLTFTSGIGTNLNISGVSTLGVVTTSQLYVSGIATVTDYVQFIDSASAYFGDGADLRIYHSGSHSFIQEQGQGNLYIQSNGGSINIRTNTSENAFVANENSSVELYYDNSKKFETTGVGITVYGDAYIAGIATIGNITLLSTGSSGGIVTATNNVGIITYYGDGSQLSGIGGAPGGAGANSQVVYNNSGSFAGSSDFTFDGLNVKVSGALTATSNKSTWAQVGSGLTFTSGIGTNLNISGVGTIGFATVSQLYVSGISTFSSTINVGLLTASNLYVSGIATAQDFDALSDERYKTNINTVGNALLKVQQLRGVKFDWKESGLGSYGVVAQELEEVLPELVHGNDPKTVNYNGIIGVLIEAIKELHEEVNELKEKIDK